MIVYRRGAPTPPQQNTRRVLTVAVVVAGMLIGIALVFSDRWRHFSLPGGDSGTSAEKSAALRLDALLTESVDGRKHLLTAIEAATACKKSSAASQMRTASAARKALITKTGHTDLAKLSGLKSGLVGFLQASYASDQAYLHWVTAASGCPSTKASSFDAVESANARARTAKTAFLNGWSPIAKRYGLPARTVTSI
jgi:hypothetical protein